LTQLGRYDSAGCRAGPPDVGSQLGIAITVEPGKGVVPPRGLNRLVDQKSISLRAMPELFISSRLPMAYGGAANARKLLSLSAAQRTLAVFLLSQPRS
jgi:hypothetical protein